MAKLPSVPVPDVVPSSAVVTAPARVAARPAQRAAAKAAAPPVEETQAPPAEPQATPAPVEVSPEDAFRAKVDAALAARKKAKEPAALAAAPPVVAPISLSPAPTAQGGAAVPPEPPPAVLVTPTEVAREPRGRTGLKYASANADLFLAALARQEQEYRKRVREQAPEMPEEQLDEMAYSWKQRHMVLRGEGGAQAVLDAAAKAGGPMGISDKILSIAFPIPKTIPLPGFRGEDPEKRWQRISEGGIVQEEIVADVDIYGRATGRTAQDMPLEQFAGQLKTSQDLGTSGDVVGEMVSVSGFVNGFNALASETGIKSGYIAGKEKLGVSTPEEAAKERLLLQSGQRNEGLDRIAFLKESLRNDEAGAQFGSLSFNELPQAMSPVAPDVAAFKKAYSERQLEMFQTRGLEAVASVLDPALKKSDAEILRVLRATPQSALRKFQPTVGLGLEKLDETLSTYAKAKEYAGTETSRYFSEVASSVMFSEAQTDRGVVLRPSATGQILNVMGIPYETAMEARIPLMAAAGALMPGGVVRRVATMAAGAIGQELLAEGLSLVGAEDAATKVENALLPNKAGVDYMLASGAYDTSWMGITDYRPLRTEKSNYLDRVFANYQMPEFQGLGMYQALGRTNVDPNSTLGRVAFGLDTAADLFLDVEGFYAAGLSAVPRAAQTAYSLSKVMPEGYRLQGAMAAGAPKTYSRMRVAKATLEEGKGLREAYRASAKAAEEADVLSAVHNVVQDSIYDAINSGKNPFEGKMLSGPLKDEVFNTLKAAGVDPMVAKRKLEAVTDAITNSLMDNVDTGLRREAVSNRGKRMLDNLRQTPEYRAHVASLDELVRRGTFTPVEKDAALSFLEAQAHAYAGRIPGTTPQDFFARTEIRTQMGPQRGPAAPPAAPPVTPAPTAPPAPVVPTAPTPLAPPVPAPTVPAPAATVPVAPPPVSVSPAPPPVVQATPAPRYKLPDDIVELVNDGDRTVYDLTTDHGRADSALPERSVLGKTKDGKWQVLALNDADETVVASGVHADPLDAVAEHIDQVMPKEAWDTGPTRVGPVLRTMPRLAVVEAIRSAPVEYLVVFAGDGTQVLRGTSNSVDVVDPGEFYLRLAQENGGDVFVHNHPTPEGAAENNLACAHLSESDVWAAIANDFPVLEAVSEVGTTRMSSTNGWSGLREQAFREEFMAAYMELQPKAFRESTRAYYDIKGKGGTYEQAVVGFTNTYNEALTRGLAEDARSAQAGAVFDFQPRNADVLSGQGNAVPAASAVEDVVSSVGEQGAAAPTIVAEQPTPTPAPSVEAVAQAAEATPAGQAPALFGGMRPAPKLPTTLNEKRPKITIGGAMTPSGQRPSREIFPRFANGIDKALYIYRKASKETSAEAMKWLLSAGLTQEEVGRLSATVENYVRRTAEQTSGNMFEVPDMSWRNTRVSSEGLVSTGAVETTRATPAPSPAAVPDAVETPTPSAEAELAYAAKQAEQAAAEKKLAEDLEAARTREEAARVEQEAAAQRAKKQAELEAYQAEQVRHAQERAAKKAEREARIRAETDRLNKERAEKQARQDAEEAERKAKYDAEIARIKAEGEARMAQLKTEQEARRVEREAEAAKLQAQRDAERAQREAEQARRQAERAQREAERVEEQARREAQRAAETAQREAEAAERVARQQQEVAAKREALRAADPVRARFEDLYPTARPGNLKAVLRDLREVTTNESYKRIIDRLLQQGGRFESVEFRMVQAGDNIDAMAADSFSRGADANAQVYFRDATKPLLVHVRGTSLGEIHFPLDEIVVHEALHAATTDQYNIGSRLGAKGTSVAAAVDDIDNLQQQIVRELKRRRKDGGDLMGIDADALARMVNDPRELIAYGMTNAGFQALLKDIKVERNKTLWTKFVEGVARLLGLQPGDESALAALIQVTERIMDLSPEEIEATRLVIFPGSEKVAQKGTLSTSAIAIENADYTEGAQFALAEVERLVAAGESRVGAATKLRDSLPRRLEQMTDRERGIRDALLGKSRRAPKRVALTPVEPEALISARAAYYQAIDAVGVARRRGIAEGFDVWKGYGEPEYLRTAQNDLNRTKAAYEQEARAFSESSAKNTALRSSAVYVVPRPLEYTGLPSDIYGGLLRALGTLPEVNRPGARSYIEGVVSGTMHLEDTADDIIADRILDASGLGDRVSLLEVRNYLGLDRFLGQDNIPTRALQDSLENYGRKVVESAEDSETRTLTFYGESDAAPDAEVTFSVRDRDDGSRELVIEQAAFANAKVSPTPVIGRVVRWAAEHNIDTVSVLRSGDTTERSVTAAAAYAAGSHAVDVTEDGARFARIKLDPDMVDSYITREGQVTLKASSYQVPGGPLVHVLDMVNDGSFAGFVRENAEVMRALGGDFWTDEFLKNFKHTVDPTTNRVVLTAEGERQFQKLLEQYLTSKVSSPSLSSKMDKVFAMFQGLYLRARGIHESPTLAMMQLDAVLRPDIPVRNTMARVVSKMIYPARTLYVEDNAAKRVGAAERRAVGQRAESARTKATRVEASRALKIAKGSKEVNVVDAVANAIAHVTTEHARRKLPTVKLVRVTTRSVVPEERLPIIRKTVRDQLVLAGINPSEIAKQVDSNTGMITFTPTQQPKILALVNQMAGTWYGDRLPRELQGRRFTGAAMSVDAYNFLVELMTDTAAGPGSVRDRMAEAVPKSIGYAVYRTINDGAGKNLNIYRDLKGKLLEKFHIEFEGKNHIDPGIVEIVERMKRELEEVNDWMRQAGEIAVRNTPDIWLPQIVESIKSQLIPPFQVASIDLLVDLNKVFGAEAAYTVTDLLNRLTDIEDAYAAFKPAGLDVISDLETSAFAEAHRIKQALATSGLDVSSLPPADLKVLEDVAEILVDGVQRRVQTVSDRAGEIGLAMSGALDAGIMYNFDTFERKAKLYSTFFEGRWDELFDLGAQVGLTVALENFGEYQKKFSQSEALLAMVGRMRAQELMVGFSERLSMYGVGGDMTALTAEYPVGSLSGRGSFQNRVSDYIKQIVNFGEMPAVDSQGQKIYEPEPPKGGKDLAAFVKAHELLAQWGFKFGKGEWIVHVLPDGTKLLLPKMVSDNLNDAVQRQTGLAGAYRDIERARDPSKENVFDVPLTARQQQAVEKEAKATKVRMAVGATVGGVAGASIGVPLLGAAAGAFVGRDFNRAINLLADKLPVSLTYLKIGITTGIGLPNIPYYVANAFGGFMQALMGVGTQQTVRMLIRNPGFVGAVVAELFGSGKFQVSAKPIVTADGRIFTVKGTAKLAQAEGLSGSFIQAEAVRSVADDLRSMEPTFYNKMSKYPRAWQDLLMEFAGSIDNMYRVAAFVDEVRLGKSAAEAAETARKIAFDYTALTDFEKGVMRQVIMFYSYQRRNTDLFFDTLLTNPGRIAAQLRTVNYASQTLLEGEADTVLPDYLRGRLMLTMRDAVKESYDSGRVAVLAPQIPVMDVVTTSLNILSITEDESQKALIGKFTPWMQAPFVLGLGIEPFSGRELGSYDKVPRFLYETDMLLSGGTLVRGVFGAEWQTNKDPSSNDSDETSGYFQARNAKAYWIWRNLLEFPTAGRSITTLEAMDRADLGFVEAGVDAARSYRADGGSETLDAFFLKTRSAIPSILTEGSTAPPLEDLNSYVPMPQEDLIAPRQGMTHMDEVRSWVGVRSVRIDNPAVALDRIYREEGFELGREAKQLKRAEAFPTQR